MITLDTSSAIVFVRAVVWMVPEGTVMVVVFRQLGKEPWHVQECGRRILHIAGFGETHLRFAEISVAAGHYIATPLCSVVSLQGPRSRKARSYGEGTESRLF